MTESIKLDLWNLTANMTAATDAQSIFNVLGRVHPVERVAKLLYTLNGGSEREVVFNSNGKRQGRLQHAGDFNIDTINMVDLEGCNQLRFCLIDLDGRTLEQEITFFSRPVAGPRPGFWLDLSTVQYAGQIGQIVDGRWTVSQDNKGQPCLEICEEDAGYDRIILFGRQDWTTAYEIKARFCVTRWCAPVHNIGLLFQWQSHRQGNGTILPVHWTTGLGYYSSDCRGLRLHYGIDVGPKNQGEHHILAERPLSRWRYWNWRMQYAGRPVKRYGRERLPVSLPTAQIIPGVEYQIRVRVYPEAYTLTLWKAGTREPKPQLAVPCPMERLTSGSVGMVAHQCAVRLYEFDVFS